MTENATISDLASLLQQMNPVLKKEKCYFASVEEDQMMALANYLDAIVCIFREDEGLSVIFVEEVKDEIDDLSGSQSVGPFAMITLKVNSDLLAVGFLAAVAKSLAEKGISSNAASAYHHDHLFVPYDRKDDAMAALKSLAGQ